jgi:hypothetical protein
VGQLSFRAAIFHSVKPFSTLGGLFEVAAGQNATVEADWQGCDRPTQPQDSIWAEPQLCPTMKNEKLRLREGFCAGCRVSV